MKPIKFTHLIHWQSQNYLKRYLFKTKIDKIDTLIKTKKNGKIDTLFETKIPKTYPGWPHVPIKPL